MSKQHWYLIILILIVFGAIGFHQITTTLKLQRLVEQYEQSLEPKQPPPKQEIIPASPVKQVSQGDDEQNNDAPEPLAEDDLSADEMPSPVRPPDSGEKRGESPIVKATRSSASPPAVEKASLEYKAFMESHRDFLDTNKALQAEADEMLASIIPEIVSTLNSMTAEEQKDFLEQVKALGWEQAQEAGNTKRQEFDENVDSFINMLKDKGFQPLY